MLDVVSAAGAVAFYMASYLAAIYLGLRSAGQLSIRLAFGAAFRIAKTAFLIWLAVMILWSLGYIAPLVSTGEIVFIWLLLVVVTLAVAIRSREVPPLRAFWLAPWLLLMSAGWWLIGFYVSTPHPLLWYMLKPFR